MKTRTHIATAALLLTLLAPGPALAAVSIERVNSTVSTADEGLFSAAMLLALVAAVLDAIGAQAATSQRGG